MRQTLLVMVAHFLAGSLSLELGGPRIEATLTHFDSHTGCRVLGQENIVLGLAVRAVAADVVVDSDPCLRM